jgi:Mrp family chromosome partitioning ATPase
MRAGNGADVAQIVSSPLIVQLRTQQADLVRQLGELTTQYGPLHPKMKALQSEKSDLDQKIAQEVSRLAGAIAGDVTVARAHLNSLEASLKSAVQQQTSQNMSRVQLDALQANAASTRTQYESFVGRLRQTQDQDAAVMADSRLISTASAPSAPTSPKRKLIVLASIPLGLLLGAMAALLNEKFNLLVPAPALPAPARSAPRRRRADPVFPAAQIVPVSPAWTPPPVIADFPDIVSLKSADAILDQPASPFAYRMAALVRRLKSRDGAIVVTMTSAATGDGKSAIGTSLARAAAAMGRKVVLLDCDPAQKAGRAMRIADAGGLYDVLTGAIPLNRVLTRDPRSEVFVLSMLRQPPNIATMFGSAQMKKLIRLLRDNCDMVVIDCGEAGMPETWPLARLSDASLLVSRRNVLNTPALSRAVHLLGSAKAAPLGLVVTR